MSTAAVAAAAMAALTASQAPGIDLAKPSKGGDGPSDAANDVPPGDDSYHTELPPLESPEPGDQDPPRADLDDAGVPATVLAAYKKAERALAGSDAGCNLRWELLAAIGKVESGQARGGAVDNEGTTLEPILGPVLNGAGFARINDTDDGAYDGDSTFDRAVGPMQFIPSTWAKWGADGNGDGRQDPNNVFDAALAAGEYLCAGERDLSVKADLDRSILSYNHSSDYLRTVLAWYEFYREGVHKVPDGEGVLPTSPGAAGEDADRRGGGPGDGDSRDPKGDEDKPGGEDGTGGSGGTGDSDGGGSDGGGSTDDGGTDDGGDPDGGGTDGGGSTGGDEDSTPSPAQPDSLAPADDGAPQAAGPAGSTFGTEEFAVKVTKSDGELAAGVQVLYEVVGDTDAHFVGDDKRVNATTGENGVAKAPELFAGSQPHDFTVRVTLVDHEDVPATEFAVDVTEPKADELTTESGTSPSTGAGDAFADRIAVTATHDGKAVACVAVTARVLSAGGDALDAGKGPFFSKDGEEVHTLEKLRTGADGTLLLPELHAGGESGTYLLRLTTADGGTLEFTLEVK